MTDAGRRLQALLVPLLALGLAGGPLAAQVLAPKRPPPAESPRACPDLPPPQQPSAQQRESSERLVANASQAALLGDDATARDLFRRAAELDPTDASLAYRLARLHEDLGERAAAAAEYCRYLALAPESADAPEVTARVARLTPRRDDTGERAAASFQEGLRRLDGGESAEAEAAFSAALRIRPDWPEAHFNRALTFLARGDRARTAQDLERYLALNPAAPDAGRVRTAVAALRRPASAYSASGALARGVLVPGLGQFHTRRPVLGLAVLAGAGAALFAAFQPEEVTRTGIAQDPFGNPYEYRYRARERPRMAAGIGAAAAITLAGAAEAYLYARRAGSGGPRLALGSRQGGGVMVGVAFAAR